MNEENSVANYLATNSEYFIAGTGYFCRALLV